MPLPPQRRELRRDAQGRTAADRFTEAYKEWRERVPDATQEKLAAEANRIAGYSDDDPERLQQQEISQLLRGETDLSKSARAPVLAAVVQVRATWLQHGSGPKRRKASRTEILEALNDLELDE